MPRCAIRPRPSFFSTRDETMIGRGGLTPREPAAKAADRGRVHPFRTITLATFLTTCPNSKSRRYQRERTVSLHARKRAEWITELDFLRLLRASATASRKGAVRRRPNAGPRWRPPRWWQWHPVAHSARAAPTSRHAHQRRKRSLTRRIGARTFNRSHTALPFARCSGCPAVWRNRAGRRRRRCHAPLDTPRPESKRASPRHKWSKTRHRPHRGRTRS